MRCVFSKKNILANTMFQHNISYANSCSNLNMKGRLNKTLLMNHYGSNFVETQFSVLDYYPSPGFEFYLPSITLTSCFKVVLIVALSGYIIDYSHSSTLDYVIRYVTLNPLCITQLPSNTKLCLKALS